MSETRQLLHEIEAFIGSAEMAASTFGRKAVNDGKLVMRLRAGSTVTLEKAARIRQFILAHQTGGAAERTGAAA
ncbi:hypothetical protein DK389_24890 [Methylobacterium durans]|uniref:Uncharacterized protein n=1 Tax=Methylobacterium durans TaxID=2202825 RepID=A0A2U8WCV7_9HYPH|nr:hypothetical protein DK389_24890 [Methylobacterium durans]